MGGSITVHCITVAAPALHMASASRARQAELHDKADCERSTDTSNGVKPHKIRTPIGMLY